MTASGTTYWIHPRDHVRRRRWTGPGGAETIRLGTPRIA